MSRLWTVGCSNTYGHGLPDCFEPPYGPGLEPSKFAWPQLLANKLNYECVNLAQCGRGVRYCWHQLITRIHLMEPGDIVAVLWPDWASRFDILKRLPYEHEKYVVHGNLEVAETITIGNEKYEDFFEKYHDFYDRWVEFELLSDHLFMILKEKDIVLLQGFYIFPKFSKSFASKYVRDNTNEPQYKRYSEANFYFRGLPEFNKSNFLNINFSEFHDQYPLALDGAHPGPEAHEALADLYYSEYQKL